MNWVFPDSILVCHLDLNEILNRGFFAVPFEVNNNNGNFYPMKIGIAFNILHKNVNIVALGLTYSVGAHEPCITKLWPAQNEECMIGPIWRWRGRIDQSIRIFCGNIHDLIVHMHQRLSHQIGHSQRNLGITYSIRNYLGLYPQTHVAFSSILECPIDSQKERCVIIHLAQR